MFNGDIGCIMEINEEQKYLRVLFDDARELSRFYPGRRAGACLLPVHPQKSGQRIPGSRAALMGGPPMLFARNLLYTAITRAKKAVLILGRERSVAAMVQITNSPALQRLIALLKSLAEAAYEEK